MHRTTLIAPFALLLAASPLAAQGRGRNATGVPPGHLPPPGLCRVWIDGVPPGHQPGVTDCAYAYAHRPPGARVIYGGPVNGRSTYGRYGTRDNNPYVYGLRVPALNGSNVWTDRARAAVDQAYRNQTYRDQAYRNQQYRNQQYRNQQYQNRVYRDQEYEDRDGGKGAWKNKSWKHEGHGHGKGGNGHKGHDD